MKETKQIIEVAVEEEIFIPFREICGGEKPCEKIAMMQIIQNYICQHKGEIQQQLRERAIDPRWILDNDDTLLEGCNSEDEVIQATWIAMRYAERTFGKGLHREI